MGGLVIRCGHGGLGRLDCLSPNDRGLVTNALSATRCEMGTARNYQPDAFSLLLTLHLANRKHSEYRS